MLVIVWQCLHIFCLSVTFSPFSSLHTGKPKNACNSLEHPQIHKLRHPLLLAAFKTLAPLQDPKSKQSAKDDPTHWLMGNVVPPPPTTTTTLLWAWLKERHFSFLTEIDRLKPSYVHDFFFFICNHDIAKLTIKV